MIATIFTLVCLAGAVLDEFTEQLALLHAPRSAERAAAERWLRAHLVFERYPELAEAALAGDAEVRGRLVRVLSSDARHLALALALSAEQDAVLSALGREAVRAGVAHSDPRLGEPAQREGLEALLRRAASEDSPRSLLLDGRLSLAEIVEGLELVGELPLGLTLDQRIATKTIRREEELPSGPWNVLLVQLARALGVELEIHGLARSRGKAVGHFLRLTAETGPLRSGVDLISEWLFVLARDGDESSRARAARNLASSGFTPALEWMDHLVRSRADPAALEGLVLAAARGRVAPALLSPAVFDSLLAVAEAQAGPCSARILCALAHSGCFDAQGGALAGRHLASFQSATSRSRWMRLFLLERNGCARAEVAPLAQALLADPSTAPALRLQALYALAAQDVATPGVRTRPEPLRVEGLPELFRLDLDALEVQRLGRVLRLFSLVPPHSDPARVPPDWTPSERLRLLQAWMWRGESEPLSAHVAAWMKVPPAQSQARGEVLADELRPWCARGAGSLLDGILRRAGDLVPAQAGSAAEGDGIGRVRLLLGLVPAPDVPGVLARGRHELEGERSDLALLGALAGYPAPIAAEAEARAALVSRLFSTLGEKRRLQDCTALIQALERAAAGLYSAGRDAEGDTFSSTILSLCSRSKTELGRWIERQPWPPAPLAETRDVSRTLASFEVPSSL